MLVKEQPATGSVRTPSSRHVAVLVVDRHGGVSKLIRRNIETDTPRVFEAATGRDGLRVLAETPIDLMLLDPSLPDVDVRSFLRRSQAVRPGRTLRVIFISDDPPDRRLIGQFGVDGFVPKPFDIRDLVDRIDALTRSGLVLRRSSVNAAAA